MGTHPIFESDFDCLTDNMGKIATKFQGKKKELRIMILGLDSAGKTTILYRLKTAETIHSEPTVGLNVESLDYKDFTLMLWDLGGQDNLRTYWRHYYSGPQGLIFVLDCADVDRIEDAREQLRKVIYDRDMCECGAVLVYANKQDIAGVIEKEEIPELLGLNQLDVAWKIQPTCAISGDGLDSGLDWLTRETLRSERAFRKMKRTLQMQNQVTL